jgi:hypothetical protein
MFAVMAWAGGETPAMACDVFETEQDARADMQIRAARYPRWRFYVAALEPAIP